MTVPTIMLAAPALALIVIGAQRLWHRTYCRFVRAAILREEQEHEFTSPLGYFRNGGIPQFLVSPKNQVTLFFFDGFRVQMMFGLNGAWFKELHDRHGVNIVCPAIGFQSMPYDMRNIEWNPIADFRECSQIYDAYVSNLPKGHRVIVASISFGSLYNFVLAATKPADGFIMISPIVPGFDYQDVRSATKRKYNYFVKGKKWMTNIVPVYTRKSGRNKGWDIHDPEKNRDAQSRFLQNREFSTSHYFQMIDTIGWMKDAIIEPIQQKNITVLFGGQDKVMNPAIIERFIADISEKNRVRSHYFADSAHMLLHDSDEKMVKDIILDCLTASKKGNRKRHQEGIK